MGSANKTKVLDLPQWLGNEYFERLDMNEAFVSIESAIDAVDYLASIYDYDISINESGNTTTTTLTVKSTSPVTASRKTVETVNDGSTSYVVTVTIDGESETMTHTIGTTTGSGVVADA